MTRRPLKPWEVVATLLTAGQLRLQMVDETGKDKDVIFRSTAEWRPIIMCLRTGKEITLYNVKQVQIEHWPIAHEHGGPVSPDNAVISLKEGHATQTKREAKWRGKERRLKIARAAKAEVELRIGRKPKFRLKRKVSGETVRVRTK